jgi:hypothetical protein
MLMPLSRSSIHIGNGIVLTLPSFPKEIQGIIFTEVVPKLTPEIDPASLVRLGSIVRKKHREKLYEPLPDAFRKIQWVRLMAIEAISIDDEITANMQQNMITSYPYGQMRHALSVTGALFHTKSAVDSIAVFLTGFLRLTAQGGGRDFKKPKFRAELGTRDPILGSRLEEFEPWFENLQEIRDEWIHRSSIRCPLMSGPTEVGALPIPKKNIELGLHAFDKPINAENFFSTKQFLDYHYTNLVNLFRKVVERCIEIELIGIAEPPVDVEVEKKLSAFPVRATWSGALMGFRVKLGPLGF